MTKTKPRIFIECTQTYLYGGNSGIPRVVRNLVNKGLMIDCSEIKVSPLVWTRFGFFQPKGFLNNKLSVPVSVKQATQRLVKKTIKKLESIGVPLSQDTKTTSYIKHDVTNKSDKPGKH